jgi:hypothetical protein
MAPINGGYFIGQRAALCKMKSSCRVGDGNVHRKKPARSRHCKRLRNSHEASDSVARAISIIGQT